MAIVEGGNFSCSRHKFETGDIKKWNDHCDDGDHFDFGTTVCNTCGEYIEFEIPFKRFLSDGSKGISLRCEDCDEAYTKNVKTKKVVKSKDVGDLE